MEHHNSARYNGRIANDRRPIVGHSYKAHVTDSRKRYGYSDHYVDHYVNKRDHYHDVGHEKKDRMYRDRSIPLHGAHKNYDEYREDDVSPDNRKYYNYDEGSAAQKDEPRGRVALDYRKGRDSYDEDPRDGGRDTVYDTDTFFTQSYDASIVSKKIYSKGTEYDTIMMPSKSDTGISWDTSMVSTKGYDRSTVGGTVYSKGMDTRGYDKNKDGDTEYDTGSYSRADHVVGKRPTANDGRYGRDTTRDVEYDRKINGHKVKNSGTKNERGHESKVKNESKMKNKATARSSRRSEKALAKHSAPSSIDYAKEMNSINEKMSDFRKMCRDAFSCRE